MNTLHFYKYQGAGNDFVVVDNRDGAFSGSDFRRIAALCDRRFGIGADGFMMLEQQEGYPFRMAFYNSDGLPGSMCGNGGRCIAAFAYDLGLVPEGSEPFSFWSSDGEHTAAVLSHAGGQHIVRLRMKDVNTVGVDNAERNYLLNTGSPHYIEFVPDCDSVDVYSAGRRIRFSDEFPMGVNVDFVEMVEDNPEALRFRTYERGVEDETFSCGTGAVASAMAHALRMEWKEGEHKVFLTAKGGSLSVDFTLGKNYAGYKGKKVEPDPVLPFPKRFKPQTLYQFTNVFLEGFATKVFEGEIVL